MTWMGSSLSATYDIRKGLANIDGIVYVYHSRRDAVLGWLMPCVGTIDGRQGVECAGQAGSIARIQNISWSAQRAAAGWDGSHTGGTTESFVVRCFTAHIVEPSGSLYVRAAGADSPGPGKS